MSCEFIAKVVTFLVNCFNRRIKEKKIGRRHDGKKRKKDNELTITVIREGLPRLDVNAKVKKKTSQVTFFYVVDGNSF
jgi:mitochondrial fission protein ELM1